MNSTLTLVLFVLPSLLVTVVFFQLRRRFAKLDRHNARIERAVTRLREELRNEVAVVVAMQRESEKKQKVRADQQTARATKQRARAEKQLEQTTKQQKALFVELEKLSKKQFKALRGDVAKGAETGRRSFAKLQFARQQWIQDASLIVSELHQQRHVVQLSEHSGRGQRDGRASSGFVVSLTSIRPRLLELSTTIESLLDQTMAPDEVILWLSDELAGEDIPLELQAQTKRGLTIKFCQDIGPHTKLIPSLRDNPDRVIITADDDVLYPRYVCELLYTNYLKDQSKIYCTRARRINVEKKGDFNYVHDWPYVLDEREGLDLFPLGYGGVLYPPRVFDEEVFKLSEQRRLAPYADDVWFKAMTLRKRVVCKRVAIKTEEFPLRPHSQEVTLKDQNVHSGGNVKQVRDCFAHYNLWSALASDA